MRWSIDEKLQKKTPSQFFLPRALFCAEEIIEFMPVEFSILIGINETGNS